MKNDALAEDLILDYLLGNLNKEQSRRLETLIRADSQVRDQFFEIQLSMETQALKLHEAFAVDNIDYEATQSIVLDRLKETETKSFSCASESPLESKLIKLSWNWFSMRSLAVAAVLLIALAPAVIFFTKPVQNKAPGGPSILVYDIVDQASIDLNSIQTGEHIREVLYVDRDGYDGLSRAEAYAEQLWAEYLDQKQKDQKSIKGKGFVVYDLVGNQGFAGFYGKENINALPVKSTESLWLVGDTSDEAFPLGPMSGESGVFYFSLDKDEVKLSTLNEFTPVSKMDEIGGI